MNPPGKGHKSEKRDAGYQIKQGEAQRYAAMVSMDDRQIGQILDLLKALNIDDNTIVIVSGDNGGNPYFKNDSHPHGFFAPNIDPKTGKVFRGQRGLLYEGGLRVPFIVLWPGKTRAGIVSDHLGYFPDVMPTLAEAAGVNGPQGTDGISVLPTLLSAQRVGRHQPNHEYLYWEHMGQTAVRSGNWKAYQPKSGEWELYAPGQDIEEKSDVAARNPAVLDRLVQYAADAHQPHVPGEILDEELCMKDHLKVKNPTPSEAQRR